MIKIVDKAECCGCQACANACPLNCVSMKSDSEGFFYPSIDERYCINCGMCDRVCPFKKEDSLRIRKPTTLAARIKDDDIRKNSSSGGVFSILANKIIEDSGIVYGVGMSDDLKSARHFRVASYEGLAKLRGSKYLQSNTGDIYRSVKHDLDNNTKALFSGTPCQVNGLMLFLGREYKNLLTVEVVCHGVPSPALWVKYFDYLEQKYNAKIRSLNFREKREGWKLFGLMEEGDNISRHLNHRKDPYMQMFLKNLCLRPSCYNCKPKKSESMADITIADFWGVNSILPEMDDDLGTSLIMVQTRKGEEELESLKELFESKIVDFSEGIKQNPAYFESCKRPSERNTFFADMNKISFEKLQTKYCRKGNNSFLSRTILRIKTIGKRFFIRRKKQ